MPRLLLLALLLLAGCTPNIETVQDVIDLCAARNVTTYSAPALIDDRDGGCPFGEGDNIAEDQAVLTARVEEFVLADVGVDTLLCSIDLDFDGNWHYDDHFFLTWNGKVLASSDAGLVDEFFTAGSFPIYAWDDIVELQISGSSGDKFCACEEDGDADCTIPSGGNNSGRMDIEFESNLQAELALDAWTQGQVEIGLITTGDNDDEDCGHSDLDLELEGMQIQF